MCVWGGWVLVLVNMHTHTHTLYALWPPLLPLTCNVATSGIYVNHILCPTCSSSNSLHGWFLALRPHLRCHLSIEALPDSLWKTHHSHPPPVIFILAQLLHSTWKAPRNTDGPRGYPTKQSGSERDRQIPYDIIYMQNLKSDTNEPIHEMESQTQKTDLRVPGGGGKGSDRLAVWG